MCGKVQTSVKCSRTPHEGSDMLRCLTPIPCKCNYNKLTGLFLSVAVTVTLQSWVFLVTSIYGDGLPQPACHFVLFLERWEYFATTIGDLGTIGFLCDYDWRLRTLGLNRFHQPSLRLRLVTLQFLASSSALRIYVIICKINKSLCVCWVYHTLWPINEQSIHIPQKQYLWHCTDMSRSWCRLYMARCAAIHRNLWNGMELFEICRISISYWCTICCTFWASSLS